MKQNKSFIKKRMTVKKVCGKGRSRSINNTKYTKKRTIKCEIKYEWIERKF